MWTDVWVGCGIVDGRHSTGIRSVIGELCAHCDGSSCVSKFLCLRGVAESVVCAG